MTEKQQEIRLVYTGVRNLFLRIITSPLSFIFTYIVAKYLSSLPNGEVVFASWQSLYVLVLGYFTIPADIFSTLTSRYASENKPVGGILFFNLLFGAISATIYVFLVPYLVSAVNYPDYFAFYMASLLIVSFYIYRIVYAIARGKTPLVIGTITVAFQLIRLAIVLVAFYVFHLSILGVIYAYLAGYITQALLSSFRIKANLKFDIKTAIITVKKSIVTIIYYLQLILEATIVWLTIVILHNDIPIAYFESALIIANVVSWSYALYDGLIAKLGETKDPSIITTSLRLYFLISTLWLVVVISEGHALLFHIRRDYLTAIYALIVLSLSNYMRGIYSIFYYSIVMKDKALGLEESENPFKGTTAKLNVTNITFSIIGILISVISVFILRSYSPYIIAIGMSLGVLINSVWLLLTSYSISRKEYNFKVPKRDIIVSIFSGGLISFIFLQLKFVSYINMIEYGLLASIIYIGVNYLFSSYARNFIRSAIKELRKILM
ncbi:hypothetical protein EWF20_13935 [Sulfolobus sp. S-194]|uniref:hypothetical protein n=1 Tax=Sulfolobus sp. S-194 TaxID=2512240 RepID=UPI001436E998|nr:hypothetical protein [Sulfolobus sp. S-194]QIW25129.1 hypothetical protein EWF20_13935 [Sulfolobus sp. S-194]